MTYDEAKLLKAALEGSAKLASDALKAFPRNAMGLTPDDVKQSREFAVAKVAYANAHAKLANFNSKFMKTFGVEYRNERAR